MGVEGLSDTLGIDEAWLAKLPPEQRAYLSWQAAWSATARPEQLPPETGWDELGIKSGRGWGKTKTAAEWIARDAWEDKDALPRHLIAPTFGDVRFTCFEGHSGLLSVIPPELVDKYNASDSFLVMTNGAVIRGFSAEKPERLRGPQCAALWAEEVAAWGLMAEDCWDMAMFGLRLGPDPRVLWTSTPKPIEIVRKLTAPRPGRLIINGSSYENRANLSDKFFKQLEQYEGTDLGRQEIHGELIDPEESAIIRRSWLQLWPAAKLLPKFEFIVMSLDTAFTEATYDTRKGADYSACTVWGVFTHEKHKHVMLLDCWQEQLGMPDLIKKVRSELQNRFGGDEDEALIKPLFGSPRPQLSGRGIDILLIESKGSGISLQQMLEREGIGAYSYNPGRADKLTRLHIVSPVFAKKRVWMPESDKNPGKPKTWIEPFLAQLCAYSGPGTTKHDDYIDSCSQALRLMMDKRLVEISSIAEIEKVEKARDNDWEPKGPPKRRVNPYSA